MRMAKGKSLEGQSRAEKGSSKSCEWCSSGFSINHSYVYSLQFEAWQLKTLLTVKVARLWHRLPRGGGCPVPGDIQGQAGWGSVQPDVAEGVRSLQGVWTRWPLKLHSNSNYSVFLWINLLFPSCSYLNFFCVQEGSGKSLFVSGLWGNPDSALCNKKSQEGC